MAKAMEHKVVEQSHIGPSASPPHDPKTKSLPLTFLDIPLAGPIYVRRQFFYNFPHSTHHFQHTTLPNLKRSLSHALRCFYPLAGNLLCPPAPRKPFIQCTKEDAVAFSVVESYSDFNHLSSNKPKSLNDLDHLVPKLRCKTMRDGGDAGDEDHTLVFPIVALQVTVFPQVGLCISITYCHVIDDRCCGHFIKSWSSLCRISLLGGLHVDSTLLPDINTPCFDRQVLKDPRGLEDIFLRDYYKERASWKEKMSGQSQSLSSESTLDKENYVKGTIVFNTQQISAMKLFVMSQWQEKNHDGCQPPQHVSTFVVTCAFVWTSLVRSRDDDDGGDDEKQEYFRFAADCRDRLEYPIPATYFGNCLTKCHAAVKRRELKGEGGFVRAAEAIGRAVNDMKVEPFKGAEEWKESFKKMFVLGSVLLVTGSPKFGVYQTDFGFGRPVKVEMVHSFKAMSLAECGGARSHGGVELGVVVRKDHFEALACLVKTGLEAFNC